VDVSRGREQVWHLTEQSSIAFVASTGVQLAEPR